MKTRLGGLARSTALRLAAAVAALFAAAMLVAFVSAYLLVARELEDRIRGEIEDEADGLARLLQARGPEALAAEVALRAESAGDQTFVALVRDGEPPAGDPAALGLPEGWGVVEGEALRVVERLDDDDAHLALTRVLPAGRLVIGRNLEPVEEAQEIVGHALSAGIAAALIHAAAGALWVARRTEARIARIDAALARAAAGEFGAPAARPADPEDDLGRVARAIDATLDRLSDVIASLRQVSADIAHDLKTPIQRLRATLEGLRLRRLDPQTEAVIDDALEQTDAIVRTFQALLRIAQIEGGGPRARFAPVDLRELAEAVHEAHQPAFEEEGRPFALALPAAGPVLVEGDRDLLAQMLSNLLANALRHTAPPTPATLALEADAREARLIVEDAGPGVPEVERERVFRRLYRLERSRTTEGAGLGLALVAAVADLHGGSARLEEARPGLRAVVRVPLATDAPPAPEPPAVTRGRPALREGYGSV